MPDEHTEQAVEGLLSASVVLPVQANPKDTRALHPRRALAPFVDQVTNIRAPLATLVPVGTVVPEKRPKSGAVSLSPS